MVLEATKPPVIKALMIYTAARPDAPPAALRSGRRGRRARGRFDQAALELNPNIDRVAPAKPS